MGDIISAIYDDYTYEYKELCKAKGVQPVGIRDNFYDHMDELKGKEPLRLTMAIARLSSETDIPEEVIRDKLGLVP